MSFYDKVYEIVLKIPEGKVATYGQIAFLLGSPKASRAVGYALHFNPNPNVIKCYKVVDRFGRVSKSFAFGGENEQVVRLQSEGIEVNGYHVDLSKYLWDGKIEN